MSEMIKQLEDNQFVFALAVVVANVGIMFLKDDLTEKQKDFLNNYLMRKIYIFALIYCGTKNLTMSLVATLIYTIIVHWII